MRNLLYLILSKLNYYVQVIWQNIEYNIGNAYDSSSGKFTSPFDGIYFFNVLANKYGAKHAYIYISVNGSNKIITYTSDEKSHDFVSYSGQLKLNKGDSVWIYCN